MLDIAKALMILSSNWTTSGMTLTEATTLIERLNAEATVKDVFSPEALLTLARTLPEVTSNVPDKKILAIKALRQAGQDRWGVGVVGLLEAKNVIDILSREAERAASGACDDPDCCP